MTRRYALSGLLLAAAFFALPCSTANADALDDAWTQFRSTYPFHVQAIGLSGTPTKDGHILIIAEPPPHISQALIMSSAGNTASGWRVKQHRIGHDGWVRDLVAYARPADDVALRTLVDSLHEVVLGSAFRANAIQLPALPPEEMLPETLDLKVTTSDLAQWIVEDNCQFQPIVGGKPRTLDNILAGNQSTIFVSQHAGLVLWAFPRDADLSQHTRSARQFAVLSDLILGAVTNGKWIGVFGRERVVSTSVLAPLRAETIQLLASVKTDELAQSYERTHPFAGTFDSVWDWAPILLSPELVDTEYGSLLNITDQLLKSWSSNGLVEYEAFLYPEPRTWPFEKPIISVLEADQITFNWNTKGAGYIVDDGTRRWHALNRTGALPVTYIPEGSDELQQENVAREENVAYDYFSTQTDPLLARVVQYAAIYQIFRNLRTSEDQLSAELEVQRRGNALFASKAKDALNKVSSLDEVAIRLAAQRILKLPNELSEEQEVERDDIIAAISDFNKFLTQYKTAAGDDDFTTLSELLVNPRRITAEDLTTIAKATQDLTPPDNKDEVIAAVLGSLPDIRSKAIVTAMALRQSGATELLTGFVDITEIKDEYAKVFEGRAPKWIATPSIVVSRTLGELSEASGGHNLDAAAPEFRPGEVAPHKFRATRESGKLIVEYNAADRDQLPLLVREAGRSSNSPKITEHLESALQESPQLKPQEFNTAVYRNAVAPQRGDRQIAWASNERPATEAERTQFASIVSEKSPVILIERRGNEYAASRMDGPDTITTFNIESQPRLIDYLKTCTAGSSEQDAPLRLHLSGFNQQEAEGLLSVLGLWSAEAPRRPSLISRSRGAQPLIAKDSVLSKFNFSKATIGEAKLRNFSEGRWKGYTEIATEVTVPHFETLQPSLFLRIRVFVKQSVQETIAAVKTGISKLCSRAPKTQAEFLDGIEILRGDLKKYDVFMDIEILDHRKQLLDLYQVKNELGAQSWFDEVQQWRQTTACWSLEYQQRNSCSPNTYDKAGSKISRCRLSAAITSIASMPTNSPQSMQRKLSVFVMSRRTCVA